MGRKKTVCVGDGAASGRQRARESGRAGCISSAARPAVVAVVDHADPVGALAAWASVDVDCPAWTPAQRSTDGAPRLRGGLAAGVVGRA